MDRATDQLGFHQTIPATFWRDQQGVFTITMLVGSVDVSFLQAGNFDADQVFHSRDFDTPDPPDAVPAPGTFSLFTSGLALMGWLGWRKKQLEQDESHEV